LDNLEDREGDDGKILKWIGGKYVACELARGKVQRLILLVKMMDTTVKRQSPSNISCSVKGNVVSVLKFHAFLTSALDGDER
jgi:hypothetical protein